MSGTPILTSYQLNKASVPCRAGPASEADSAQHGMARLYTRLHYKINRVVTCGVTLLGQYKHCIRLMLMVMFAQFSYTHLLWLQLPVPVLLLLLQLMLSARQNVGALSVMVMNMFFQGKSAIIQRNIVLLQPNKLKSNPMKIICFSHAKTASN